MAGSTQYLPTGYSQTPNNRPPKLHIFLAICGVLAAIGVIFLLTFLACDVMYIPYLSELSHFLVLLISPFVPLLFPGLLGVFLKVCQRETWSKKKSWILITGSWVFQHLQRAVTDAIKLWGHGDICGLHECTGKWVEWVLVLVVVGCQIGGWKWDHGYVDRWIDTLVWEDVRRKAREDAERIAKGEMLDKFDLEKADMLEDEEYTDAEEEKWEVKARDGY